MNKSTPTQAVRDYNTYDKMYLKTNTNEVFTYVPKRENTSQNSRYYKHNTTNLDNALFNINYLTQRYFYKASDYTGKVINFPPTTNGTP